MKLRAVAARRRRHGNSAAPIRQGGSPYNEMTQTSSAIIAAIKPSIEYAKLCMSMRLGNACYSGMYERWRRSCRATQINRFGVRVGDQLGGQVGRPYRCLFALHRSRSPSRKVTPVGGASADPGFAPVLEGGAAQHPGFLLSATQPGPLTAV
jgi:hypothetical protein